MSTGHKNFIDKLFIVKDEVHAEENKNEISEKSDHEKNQVNPEIAMNMDPHYNGMLDDVNDVLDSIPDNNKKNQDPSALSNNSNNSSNSNSNNNNINELSNQNKDEINQEKRVVNL